MTIAGTGFAFRWLLPVAQLVLCAAALWPSRSLLIHEVEFCVRSYSSAPARPEPPSLDQGGIIVLEDPVYSREFYALQRRAWVPAMLNLPAGLLQLPYAIFISPTKQEWLPRAMDFKIWRALSWPFLGIPFWWSAGRGIEALAGAKRYLLIPKVSWIETILGATLFIFCSVAAICMPLFSSPDDGFPMKLWIAVSSLWALLGATIAAARLAQWRVRKKQLIPAQA